MRQYWHPNALPSSDNQRKCNFDGILSIGLSRISSRSKNRLRCRAALYVIVRLMCSRSSYRQVPGIKDGLQKRERKAAGICHRRGGKRRRNRCRRKSCLRRVVGVLKQALQAKTSSRRRRRRQAFHHISRQASNVALHVSYIIRFCRVEGEALYLFALLTAKPPRKAMLYISKYGVSRRQSSALPNSSASSRHGGDRRRRALPGTQCLRKC